MEKEVKKVKTFVCKYDEKNGRSPIYRQNIKKKRMAIELE